MVGCADAHDPRRPTGSRQRHPGRASRRTISDPSHFQRRHAARRGQGGDQARARGRSPHEAGPPRSRRGRDRHDPRADQEAGLRARVHARWLPADAPAGRGTRQGARRREGRARRRRVDRGSRSAARGADLRPPQRSGDRRDLSPQVQPAARRHRRPARPSQGRHDRSRQDADGEVPLGDRAHHSVLPAEGCAEARRRRRRARHHHAAADRRVERLMAGFDDTTIDPKWQAFWDREQTILTPTARTRPKYYVLDMFPYPSSDGLHIVHPKGYTATDIVARAKRMMGFNVLRVMGWDSFGLPAERRAERTGAHPSVLTARNIATFKSQLHKLDLSYDRSRELATSDPNYYKWTQWIFEVLFDRGLAYQSNVPVNFCPALGTVHANEEVHDGKYIETGDPVEKRNLTQWMLRITDYAERLAKDLEGLEWPAGTLQAQEAWIGRSVGATVVIELAAGGSITVNNTRPDTLFGGP